VITKPKLLRHQRSRHLPKPHGRRGGPLPSSSGKSIPASPSAWKYPTPQPYSRGPPYRYRHLHEPIFGEFATTYLRRSSKTGKDDSELLIAFLTGNCLWSRWLRGTAIIPAKEFLLNLHRDLVQPLLGSIRCTRSLAGATEATDAHPSDPTSHFSSPRS
jgi:hypothetical protein